jgi:hypothetical protein
MKNKMLKMVRKKEEKILEHRWHTHTQRDGGLRELLLSRRWEGF